ncbi:transposable element Tcb1 transposase [Trichonephila clavipes]|nr:transposable element Tcb1 transposase [Trichonephila clavipes]
MCQRDFKRFVEVKKIKRFLKWNSKLNFAYGARVLRIVTTDVSAANGRTWVAEWNEVVFTDESHICLEHHDDRIRVSRHRGERMLNSCVMHHHTSPAPGIMVWGGVGYHSRTPLIRIAGTLNTQRYISEVWKPVVLPYLQGLATAIFQ